MSPVAVIVPPVARLPLAVAVLPPVAVVVPHVAVLPLAIVVPPVAFIVPPRCRPRFAESYSYLLAPGVSMSEIRLLGVPANWFVLSLFLGGSCWDGGA